MYRCHGRVTHTIFCDSSSTCCVIELAELCRLPTGGNYTRLRCLAVENIISVDVSITCSLQNPLSILLFPLFELQLASVIKDCDVIVWTGGLLRGCSVQYACRAQSEDRLVWTLIIYVDVSQRLFCHRRHVPILNDRSIAETYRSQVRIEWVGICGISGFLLLTMLSPTVWILNFSYLSYRSRLN